MDTSEFVESVICKDSDLKENEMKAFDLDEGQVLLVKQNGEFRAVGAKCTHYGAPLVTGVLGEGRVRCPWHGACFNLKTGDIEDFPAFDRLPCFKVTVTKEGDVKVSAKKSELKTSRHFEDIGLVTPDQHSTVVIVGGGPSGSTCAETLRNEGYTGRIVILCKEKYPPYDRIKISKMGFFTNFADLEIRTQDYYENAKIQILKGVEATKIEPQDQLVYLSDGSKLHYNSLYLATGSKPLVPQIHGNNLKNIFTFRNYDDSMEILNCLGSEKEKHLVILGLSFIGLETAASCVDKAKSVTVVGKTALPLGSILDNKAGLRLKKLFEEQVIKFQFNATIVRCNGADGAIKSVALSNGAVLRADVLVLGVGTTYNTDFLKESGIILEANGTVNVNNKLETNIRNIYAGGDIAFAPVYANGNKQMSIGHVGVAQYHGKIAALNILNKDTTLKTVPFFWTYVFNRLVGYAGCGKPASHFTDGKPEALDFVTYYFDESDKVIAVASCSRSDVVAQFAEFTYQGKSIYERELKKDIYGWYKKN